MRIIGGTYRGKHLHPPKLAPTRPTTDFAKEALYNILANNWELDEVSFLDLFSGTGGHSLEFASRGCKDICSVDLHKPCIDFLNETAAEINASEYVHTYLMDVFRYISTCNRQFDLIFAGPPYALDTLDTIPDEVINNKLLTDEGWLILEHNPNHDFTAHPNFFHVRNYGGTWFSFFRYEP